MSKEIIKQFSGTIYKFVFCDYADLDVEKGENKYCGKIHIYERRIVQLEPYKAKWFYLGDLDHDTNTSPTTMDKDSGHTR